VVFAPAIPLATAIRETSRSPVFDMVAQALWLACIVPPAWFVAVLIGDVLFPNRWREREMLGIDVDEVAPAPGQGAPDGGDDDDDDEISLAAIKATHSYRMPFYLIVVALILGHAGVIEALTGGFLAEYQRLGYFRTLLRGDHTEAKLEIIGDLANKRRRQFVQDAVAQLDGVWRDASQPAEVRLAALKTLGIQAGALVTSLESWRDASSAAGRWEGALLERAQREIAPALRPLVEANDPRLARAASLALAKLRDFDSVAAFTGLVTTSKTYDERWLGAAGALGVLRSMQGMAALVQAAGEVRDPQALRYLGWAVGEISRKMEPPEDGVAPPVFDDLISTFGELLRSGSPEARCVAADTLLKVSDARVAAVLFAGFDAPGVELLRCSAHELDVDDRAPVSVGQDESLRRRILLAFKYIAKGNSAVTRWAKERLGRGGLDEETRTNLQSLLASAGG
jgi:hypothetical protein